MVEQNTFMAGASDVLRRRWPWLLGLVGLTSVGDLFKEYLRGKAMDYAVSHLGRFGDVLIANPFALTSFGVVMAVIVLTVMVVSESVKGTPSPIYEHMHKPFIRPP